MADSHRVRLSDIAKKMNVSIVTVSKALADKDGVSDELRREIKELAAAMGYRKKSHLGLRCGEHATGNIGIIIPEHFFERSTSFYWTLYNALSRELLANGFYAIMEQLSDKDESDLIMPRVVQDKKVDGIILLGQTSSSYAHYFARRHKHFIFLDFYTGEEDTDAVVTDNFFSEYKMTRYLIAQGHRDIRFVGNFNATTSITDRFMGFMKAMLENGLPVSVDDIINDRNQKGLYEAIQLPQHMPTAFVCNCDETAVRLIEVLRKNGYEVPRDISVVGFDNFVSSGTSVPALTTVGIAPDALARAAVELLLKKISGQPYTHGQTVISGNLIIRDSVRQLPR